MKIATTNTILLLLFTIIIVLGCSQKLEKSPSERLPPPVFSVNSTSFTIEDTLRINLPIDRPSNISIQSPKGRWYIVHSKENNVYIVPFNEFNRVQYLDIPLSTIEGLTWIDGKKSKQRVFQELGEYAIYMADNLETEPDNTFHFLAKILLE